MRTVTVTTRNGSPVYRRPVEVETWLEAHAMRWHHSRQGHRVEISPWRGWARLAAHANRQWTQRNRPYGGGF